MEQEQPIQQEVQAQMNAFAWVLDEALNNGKTGEDREWAFALFVFKFGEGEDHRSNYISNAQRDTMIATLKEFIARVEGRHVELKEGVRQ